MIKSIRQYLRKLKREISDSDPAIVQSALSELKSLENIGLLKLQTEPFVYGAPQLCYKTTSLGRSALKRLMRLWYQAITAADWAMKGVWQ
jgi:DNA-binding HxlR family transcriptional regulator